MKGKSRISKSPTGERKPVQLRDSKAAEFRAKQEKIKLAAKERTLMRKTKQLDKEQKQIHVDNQLNNLLGSLLKLEGAYRAQELERAETNKQMADLINQKNETEFVLEGTRQGVKRMADSLRGILGSFPFDKDSDVYKLLQKQQREMEDMAGTNWKTSENPAQAADQSSVPPVPPEAPPEIALSIPIPAPPTAPMAPAAPMPPSAPPLAPMAPPPLFVSSETNFLNGIRGGVAGLKKVLPKDLEKGKPSGLGGIFESLHDTLTAGTNR